MNQLHYFQQSPTDVIPKWNGILNTPICPHVLSYFHDDFCESKNIAVVYPANQFISKRLKCHIYELSGFIPNQYVTLLISKRSKHEEKINQAYLKMREVGIVDRLSKRYGMIKGSIEKLSK